MIEIHENMLAGLRLHVMSLMSPKRFGHTVAVEEMAARLAVLFCPEQTNLLRAAALLHDITKERTAAEQEQLCADHGLTVTDGDRLAPKTFHARTAAALIVSDYPELAHPVVVDAVRWHTTGHAGMTLTEKLIYLADYIDQSRTFPTCVLLRRYFWGADPARMTPAEREALLRETLILSYDLTIRDLLDEGKPIAADTVEARNELLLEQKRAEQ
jgi:nicotinate-nucleotide adenylyltransferase